MKQEQIQENNKLIAEFLNAKTFAATNEYELYGIIETIEDGENVQHFFDPEEMDFHSDWNWIMTVVSKCYEYGELDNHYREEIIASLAGVIDIEDTYNAVVDFVKDYNKRV